MRNAVDATGRAIKKLSDVEAMQLGNVSLLKDRHSRGVLRNKSLLCGAAARSGQLEELKALRAKNFPWDGLICIAAKGGHLEVLKWARENVCPWGPSDVRDAAEYGHLEMLKWARENDCPWNWRTCAYAARYGHLEVLKWARENDCPWDWRTAARYAYEVRSARERTRPGGVCGCGKARPPRGGSRWARERLPVGRADVRARGEGRPPRGAGARRPCWTMSGSRRSVC